MAYRKRGHFQAAAARLARLEPPAIGWYAGRLMPSLTPPRTSALPLLGLLCGALLGLAAFAVSAALWRSGATQVAAITAEATFLIALAAMATAILAAPPTRLRRARVPVGRAMPHAWWPPQHDPVPLMVACVGAPLAIGAGAAVWLFR